jgi:prolyl oligopeptidase
VLVVSFCALPLIAAAESPQPPPTRRAPVTDTYHGTDVVDEYRWLEDGGVAEVTAWIEAQNAYTRSVLDRMPGAASLRRRVQEIRTLQVPRMSGVKAAGGRLFAVRFTPPQQQPVLVTLPGADAVDQLRVILDLNQLDPSGATSMDWFEPSFDGRYVAVSLAKGGSERGELHVYDVTSGRPLPDVIPRVNYAIAGGSVAWDARSEGFYYTRYPRPGERPEADLDFFTRVYYHRLGTPDADDRYEIGKDFERIAEIQLRARPDGRYLLANVQLGDGGEFEQYLRREDGSWTRLSRFADGIVDAVFDPAQERLLMLSRQGAPRRRVLELALRPTGALAPPRPFLPEGEAVIATDYYGGSCGIIPTPHRIYLVEELGGVEQVRMLDREGRALGRVPLPEASGVYEALPEPGADALLLASVSYVQPRTWYRFLPDPQPKAASGGSPGQLARTSLSVDFPISLADATVSREWCVSRDGTRVPLAVVAPKGAPRDGSSPALLTGYGGYGISSVPSFDPALRIWLDHGGVFAVAGLRGGSEFGQAWREDGRLLKKQNVFDDFIACAEHLVKERYTQPRRLAIQGGSNGGLLMGAAMTQRPDLFGAVVSHVGVYDMLRTELSPNGSFNVPEYGSVKDPAQFRALYAYSPYHHVKDGVAYPPILLPAGANDPRVDPMHSRKLAARLQAATGGKSLVLLRASSTSGHGIGTALDERIALEADVWAFLFAQLGVSAHE